MKYFASLEIVFLSSEPSRQQISGILKNTTMLIFLFIRTIEFLFVNIKGDFSVQKNF
jgi:hypothetical protein